MHAAREVQPDQKSSMKTGGTPDPSTTEITSPVRNTGMLRHRLRFTGCSGHVHGRQAPNQAARLLQVLPCRHQADGTAAASSEQCRRRKAADGGACMRIAQQGLGRGQAVSDASRQAHPALYTTVCATPITMAQKTTPARLTMTSSLLVACQKHKNQLVPFSLHARSAAAAGRGMHAHTRIDEDVSCAPLA